MKTTNRIKSALISGMIAATSMAGGYAATAPSLSASAADTNYAKLLQYSLYLYDANMCGDNSDCGIEWRGNCHMNDDVPGGFHDAGDHVMFGQPQGYAASTLGWAYYEFKDAFEETGQGAHLKVITDKFCKFFRDATVLNGNTVQKVLIEKGDGDTDHAYWGPPEQQGGRGQMLWSTGGAANITAEYAAALAVNYVNFGNPDDLKYAQALYDFSLQNTNCHNSQFYDGHWTGADDEIDWAAGWLYLATNDGKYLNRISGAGQSYSNHSWESVQLGAGILKGEITGDWGSAGFLSNFQGNNYCFLENWEWGSARQNCTAQFCTLVAAKHSKGGSDWAKGQMEYITGDKAFANGQTHCLVVGFKDNSSKNPHHRASSPDTDASKQNDGTPNKYLLVGALCGGPLDANGTYQDIRSDYQGNEVAVDYNAGLVGAAAGLYHFYKGGSPVTSIPGVKKIYSGSSSVETPTQPTVTQPPQQQETTQPPQQTTQPQVQNPTQPSNPGTSSGDIVLLPDDMTVGTEKGDDGEMNSYAEFKPQGAKSATLYFKINTNDTQASGGFGTWNGSWVQEDFENVKADANKEVVVDYTIPSDVGATVKAMIWWPHGDGVTIEKVVLHKDGSSTPVVTQAPTAAPTTAAPTTTVTTTTTQAPTQPPQTQPTQPQQTQPAQNQPTATKYGDANEDGKVNIADAVAILQYVANASKYALTETGKANADIDGQAGITGTDAIVIQKLDAGVLQYSQIPLR